jgi:hypothetical protein
MNSELEDIIISYKIFGELSHSDIFKFYDKIIDKVQKEIYKKPLVEAFYNLIRKM